MPLTWEITTQGTDDGRIRVVLDFAGQGEIRLICNHVEVLDDFSNK